MSTRRVHRKRDWQAAFDALGGPFGQFGPGGRKAMTDSECKAVVMAHERTVTRVEHGLPPSRRTRRILKRLARLGKRQ